MSITLNHEGFVVVLGNSFTVEEVIHNGRGHKNTVVEHTHYETASIIPDTLDIHILDRVFLRQEHVKPKKDWRESMNTDDFGPQRFCKDCGEKLTDVYDTQDSTPKWIHTLNLGCECIDSVSGYMQHTDMDMDDLRMVYKKLTKKSDVEWLKTNKDALKAIYHDHDDDRGRNRAIECCKFKEEVNDDEGNVLSTQTDFIDQNDSDVGVSDEEKTHLTIDQLKFWRSILWYIGHYAKGGKDKALKAYKEGHITYEELKYCLSMLEHSGKWKWIIAGFSNVTKSNKKTGQYRYTDLLDPCYKAYRYTEKKKGLTYHNYNDDIHRVLHFYCPTQTLKDGFLLQIDWDKKNGFTNKQQWRLFGEVNAREFYNNKIRESLNERMKTHTKNVLKESRDRVIFKDCWNMWLSNTEEYFSVMKKKLA